MLNKENNSVLNQNKVRYKQISIYIHTIHIINIILDMQKQDTSFGITIKKNQDISAWYTQVRT